MIFELDCVLILPLSLEIEVGCYCKCFSKSMNEWNGMVAKVGLLLVEKINQEAWNA